jgi:hypothetical protein
MHELLKSPFQAAPGEQISLQQHTVDFALQGGQSEASLVKPNRLACVEVLLSEAMVVLQKASLQPWWLESEAPIHTGKVKSTAQRLIDKEDIRGKVLVPAGIWKPPGGGQPFHVLAIITQEPRSDGVAVKLGDLLDPTTRAAASLAMAKVLAHTSGYTTVQDLAPLLDNSGSYATGALLAKQLHPPQAQWKQLHYV